MVEPEGKDHLIRELEEKNRQLEEMLQEKERVICQHETRIQHVQDELGEKNRQLQEANLALYDKSVRDSLTGLYNHQYIHEAMATEIEQAKRYGNRMTVIMFDLDDFKQVNDGFGHPSGDEVLKDVAGIFSDCVRKSDIIGRYGGEEFTLILPQTDCQHALELGERIRRIIEGYSFLKGAYHAHASAGIAEYQAGDDVKSLIARADKHLYTAKKMGKNRVVSDYSQQLSLFLQSI